VGHHEREQCYACSGSGPDPGRIEAIELRAPLAAMTSARDGDFAKVPETGEGLTAELGAMFDQIMDRGGHCNAELTRVRREIVRHGRLDERVDERRRAGRGEPGAGLLGVAGERREHDHRRSGGTGGECDAGPGRGGGRRPHASGRPARREPSAPGDLAASATP
jgi:hypothetical protein